MDFKLILATKTYVSQTKRWPSEGRHILAQFDAETIIVYQAYRKSIGEYAMKHQALGGPDFSFSRMSWIKPNFLWMMYRSGWATKPDQEGVIGLRIRRSFFDGLLANAVASTFDPEQHSSHAEWNAALARSDIRLQWDPDHSPTGAKLARRAIQLGLRGETLKAFATHELLEVIDLSAFIAEQSQHVTSTTMALMTPTEDVYVPELAAANKNVRLDAMDRYMTPDVLT